MPALTGRVRSGRQAVSPATPSISCPRITSSAKAPVTQDACRSVPSRVKPARAAARIMASLSASVSTCSRCIPRTSNPYRHSSRTVSTPSPRPRYDGRSDSPMWAIRLCVSTPHSTAAPASSSPASSTTENAAGSSRGSVTRTARPPIRRNGPPRPGVAAAPHGHVVVQLGLQDRDVAVVPGPQGGHLTSQHAAFLPEPAPPINRISSRDAPSPGRPDPNGLVTGPRPGEAGRAFRRTSGPTPGWARAGPGA